MPLIDPSRQVVCPFFFTSFNIGHCEVVSTRTTGKVINKAPSGIDKVLSLFWIPSLDGPEYTAELACWRCPNPQCQEPLPHNIEYMDNHIIALVGGRSSGKSHYIATLINELERGRDLEHIGCAEFRPSNQSVSTRYRQGYYEPFFGRREVLPFTPTVVGGNVYKPLVYEMLFERKQSWRRPKSVNLVIFDVSGEDIQDQVSLAVYCRYIMHASAMIFLIDPLAMPGVRDKLPEYLRPKVAPGDEAFRILNSVVQIYERYKGTRPGTRISVPAALTVAKSDLMKYVQDVDMHSIIFHDPDYSDGIKMNDMKAISDEVEAIIDRIEGPALLRPSKRFTNRSFFSISATGCSSDDTGHFPTISPRRCLDPLFWALWKLGVVEGS